jgi:hypothetical protein
VTDQDAINLGYEAERTAQFFNDNPYFTQLLDRMKIGCLTQIGELKADQTQQFTVLKSVYDHIMDPLMWLSGDVENARQANNRMKGITEKGIL